MILYIQTAFLGDLLLAIPSLKRLKQLYPDKKLHLLCRKGLGSFFIQTGLVDAVFDDFVDTKPSIAEAAHLFKNQKYDYVICPHESIRTHFLLTKISATVKIGYKKPWNFLFFDKRIPRPMHLPEALRQMALVAVIDQELKEKINQVNGLTAPFQQVPEWCNMNLDFFLDKQKYKNLLAAKNVSGVKVIALAPGSVWPTKRWGIDKYKELTKMLLDKGYSVVLLGTKDEKISTDPIAQEYSQVINLTGQTNLFEMAKVLAGCDYLVANDSGAMHMASVTGTSCIAIFGPTVTSFGYQPWSPVAQVIENQPLACRPCSAHGTLKCPIGTHECMKSISTHQVLKAITF